MTTKTKPSMPVRANGPAGLVGLYFHTFVQAEDGCWVSHYQGHIDSLTGDDLLLVTLFEWLIGTPNSTEFMRVADLVEQHAEFYDNPDDWRNAPQYSGGRFLSSRRHWDRDHVR